MGEIQALGHHLGAHQYIRFALPHLAVDLLVPAPLLGDVAVQPEHPGFGKHFFQLHSHPLGAYAELADMAAAAGGTDGGRDDAAPAVVAFQTAATAFLVIAHGHGAVRAGDADAAVAAGIVLVIAAPVQKEHGLISLFQRFPDGLLQGTGKDGAVALSQFFPEVHHLHLGQRGGEIAVAQGAVGVTLAHRGGGLLHPRSGAAQHQGGAGELAALFRHGHRVEAGIVVLFIAGLMGFVDDD